MYTPSLRRAAGRCFLVVAAGCCAPVVSGALVLAAEPSGVAGWQAKLTPSLAAQVAQGARELPCIVTLREPQDVERVAAASERARWVAEGVDTLAAELGNDGVVVTRRYRYLPLVAVRVPAAALPVLAGHPLVAAVTPVRVARAMRTEGKQLMHVPEVLAQGFRGTGIGIAVLDTGVDYTHTELSPAGTKTIKLFDAIANDSDPMDEEGHGTAVAAIAGGSGNGVAPEARIVAVRVLNAEGEGSSAQILAGIDAVLDSIAAGNPHNIRVLNMSLGGYDDTEWPPGEGNCDALSTDFATAFQALVDAGVLVVVAAGNGGCSTGVAWPACISTALAVGAVYDANVGFQMYGELQCNFLGCFDLSPSADGIACYSDSGSKLGVWAPSHCATTARKGGGQEACFGGTSAAAPYVAGVAALLSQAVATRTVTALRQALESSGRVLRDTRNNVERRRVDAQAALALLGSGCTPPAPPLGLAANRTHICRGEQLTLSWGAVTGAANYTLEVDDSPSFGSPEATLQASGTSVGFSTTRSTNATLHFRVRANAACGLASEWSSSTQVAYTASCSGSPYVRTYFVSGIARLPGVPPADWYSDLAVLNTSGLSADVRLSFYGNATPPSVTMSLLARQQVTWSNVLPSLFGLANQDVGAIVVESTQPLLVTARTYSRQGEGSAARTYGQSYDGMEIAQALTGTLVGYLPGLRSDGQFRTNFEVVNVGDVAATVEVRFFNNGGAALGQPLSLGVQPNRRAAVTRALPSGAPAAYAEVRVAPAAAKVIAFASVVDGSTGDPTTVVMGVR